MTSKRILFTMLTFVFLGLSITNSQTSVSINEKSVQKHMVSFELLKSFMAFGIGYKYAIWNNAQKKWQIGAQTGIASGFDKVGQPQGWSVPLGLFTEYGNKHRIGLDAVVMYQWSNPIVYVNGDKQRTGNIRYNWAFSSSLFYSFNFGKNMNYSAGLGGSIITYAPISDSPVDYRFPTSFRPYLSFGVRF